MREVGCRNRLFPLAPSSDSPSNHLGRERLLRTLALCVLEYVHPAGRDRASYVVPESSRRLGVRFRGSITIPLGSGESFTAKDQRQVVIVHLEGTDITDADLGHLTDFPKLGGLYLKRTAVTDAALATIEGMAELQDLDLSETRISFVRLAGLTKLQQLDLSGRPGRSLAASKAYESRHAELE